MKAKREMILKYKRNVISDPPCMTNGTVMEKLKRELDVSFHFDDFDVTFHVVSFFIQQGH